MVLIGLICNFSILATSFHVGSLLPFLAIHCFSIICLEYWEIVINLSRKMFTSIHTECVGENYNHNWHYKHAPADAKCSNKPSKRSFRCKISITDRSHCDYCHPSHVSIHCQRRNRVYLVLCDTKQKSEDCNTDHKDGSNEGEGRVFENTTQAKNGSWLCSIHTAYPLSSGRHVSAFD